MRVFCLETVIKTQAQKIKPVVHFSKIPVGKVQGKNLGAYPVAYVFADKYAFAEYKSAFHVLVAAVAHIWAQSRPKIPSAN